LWSWAKIPVIAAAVLSQVGRVGDGTARQARGASLDAVCAGHQFQSLFTITGLDRQMPLARSVTEAYQNLAAARKIRVNGHRKCPA
jgi:hypothetical protein